MKQTLIFRSETVRANAIQAIDNIPLEPLHQMIISEYSPNRRVAQNSLYWLLVTVLAAEQGHTKNSVHPEGKKDFLVPIYERDDLEFANMVETIRDVYRAGLKDESKHLFNEIARLTSTTKANVKQFTEFLNDIDHYAIDKDIKLPTPDDKYYLAMGIKQ